MSIDTTILASSTAVAAILGVLFTKGVEALVKLRKERRADVADDTHRAVESYEFLIAKLDARVTALEGELHESREQHVECVKNYAILEGKWSQCLEELNWLRDRLANPKEAK